MSLPKATAASVAMYKQGTGNSGLSPRAPRVRTDGTKVLAVTNSAFSRNASVLAAKLTKSFICAFFESVLVL
jgi:hypothetical protein